ncbi:MAG: c-type cytochrome [Fimbriimonadaceae bacterium]|nr:c-type cytochrome [Fimbriimonadaceae bacterium]
MKALLLASLIPALALTWSAAGPVDTHIATLQKATALSVKYKVVQAGSSPQDHSLSLSRDLKMRLETPAMLWVSDGKTLSTYNKAKQTYTQIPADKPTLAKLLQGESTWAWSAFLDPEFAKPITSAKPGDEINQKGVILQEIKISRPAGAITEMFDGAMGVFRGASYTKDQVQVFVQVTEIKVTDKPLPDALFAWTPPTGATLNTGATSALVYADVKPIFQQYCGKCHGNDRATKNLNTLNYDALMSSNTIRPGDSARSILVNAMRTGAMPRGGSMPKEDIDKIAQWVDDGAK